MVISVCIRIGVSCTSAASKLAVGGQHGTVVSKLASGPSYPRLESRLQSFFSEKISGVVVII